MNNEHTLYGWADAERDCSHEYLLPRVGEQTAKLARGKKINILDIGCGNGFISSKLAEQGHSVIGIDASPDGISIARRAFPRVQFHVRSVYDGNLSEVVGHPVDCIVSLEVVEHLFYPRRLFEQSHALLRDGGSLIVSTPYHGYLKNLALSLVNGWDKHFHVGWDGGHIKFFSERTLAEMARDAGFTVTGFYGVGRLPGLWKSMIMVMKK